MSSADQSAARPENNFDGLRLVGAFMVLVGHGFVLTGHPRMVPQVLGIPVHTFGVYVFFSISGYLIAASWMRTRSLWTYWTARVLRIFPALLAIVTLTVFVLGPLVTTLSMDAYVHHRMTWAYFDNARLLTRWGLPGVFPGNVYPNAINGSIWTLPVEFACYLAIPIVFALRSRVVAVLVLTAAVAGSVWLTLYPPSSLLVWYGTSLRTAVPFWATFAVGSLIFLARQTWPGFLRADVAGLVLICMLLISLRAGHPETFAWIALPYAVLTMGLASTPYVRRAARFGDLSYGVYLWAYPIQQLVVWKFGVLPVALNLVLVAVLTLIAAYASWHLVERHALSLAKVLGRRGGRAAAPRRAQVATSTSR